jgi:hypothetical protein
MLTARWLISLLCVMPCAVIAGNDERLELGATSCAIQMSLVRSPNNYLIAVLEHLGKIECAHNVCTETLRVVRTIAARRPEGGAFGETIDVLLINAPSTSGNGAPAPLLPTGHTEIGIYVPAPVTQAFYSASMMSPVTPQLESIWTRAVNAVNAAPAGTDFCASAFSPNNLYGDPRQ